ncbi:DUF4153 domain-containing protein [Myxococcus faecalis]|uniref:DUF4153 domain-containing protein n=2 Tax=Myxococcus TaxID=32 RepID=UPI003CEA084A
MSSSLPAVPTTAKSAAPVEPVVRPRVKPFAPRRTLGVALAVGVLAEVLLGREHWGVSFPLVVLALVGALLGVGGREGWQRAAPNTWLLAPLLGVAGFMAVRDSPWLQLLNLVTVGALLALVAHFWAAGRVERLALGDYPGVVVSTVFRSLVQPPAMVREAVDLRGAMSRAPRVFPLLRGLALALPVVGVFLLLLGSADAAFASALERVLALEVGAVLEEGVGRVSGVLLSASATAALVGHALRRRTRREPGEEEVGEGRAWLGLTEALTLLIAVDVLFLVFVRFQVAYLFVGDAVAPAPGYSYAEYARRGFFELLLVSMLTLCLIMALARWTVRGTAKAKVAFQVAASVMTVLTVAILASAMKRLGMYEDAFGYTRLRVFTHVFMVFLGGVLAWRGVTLWWRPERFAVGAFAAALGAVVTVNVINPDALIVRHNLARELARESVEGAPRAEGAVDVGYLYELSLDAVPELARGLSSTQQLSDEFRARACADVSWPEWSLSRWRACRALSALAPEPVSAGGS